MESMQHEDLSRLPDKGRVGQASVGGRERNQRRSWIGARLNPEAPLSELEIVLEVNLLLDDPEAQQAPLLPLADLLHKVAVLVHTPADVANLRLAAGGPHRPGKRQPQEERRLMLDLLIEDDRIPGPLL